MWLWTFVRYFSEAKCTQSRCLCVWWLVVAKEVGSHAYVPVSPALLNFELIVQVQAIFLGRYRQSPWKYWLSTNVMKIGGQPEEGDPTNAYLPCSEVCLLLVGRQWAHAEPPQRMNPSGTGLCWGCCLWSCSVLMCAFCKVCERAVVSFASLNRLEGHAAALYVWSFCSKDGYVQTWCSYWCLYDTPKTSFRALKQVSL